MLKDAGAELVFFEDGLIETEKYVTWIERQNSRYQEHNNIIDYINMGQSVDSIVSTLYNELSGFSTVIPIIEHMAEKHGTLKFSVHKDCDVEIVRYAKEHGNCLAILTDDSDFLIFEGDFRVWSINSLNVRSLTTREFNRNALRVTLGLNDDQLQILATIAGNGVIKNEEVQDALGRNFRHTPGLKFPNIANFIKYELTTTNKNERAEIIAKKMLGNSRKETIERVKISLDAYQTVSCTEKSSSR